MVKRILMLLFCVLFCFAFCVDLEARAKDKKNRAPKNPTPIVRKFDKTGKTPREMAAVCFGSIEEVSGGEDFKVFVTDHAWATIRIHKVPTLLNGRRVGEWCMVPSGADWKVRFVDDEAFADFSIRWSNLGGF